MTDFVKINGLYKSFSLAGREIRVLRGIDLSIKKGEMVSLTGKSGAGKSTFLHILGTLDIPDYVAEQFSGHIISPFLI